MTFGEWLTEWRERYKVDKVKPATLSVIDTTLRLHVPDDLKAKPLADVTARDLEGALAQIATSRTRQYTQGILDDALRRAVDQGEIASNPMARAVRVRHTQKRGRALTGAERVAFLDKLRGHPLRPLYEFYLWTGCRRSEALSLTWDDVDTVDGTLRIRGTKTTGSDRVLPLFDHVRGLLDALPLPHEGRVFDCLPDHATKVFHELCPRHKLHDLRHTFATRCLECGIALNVVQRWLGHSTPKMLLQIYAHILDGFQRAEARKLQM